MTGDGGDGEDPIGRLIRIAGEPAPPHPAAIGRELVGAATPGFRNFRVDLEAVQSAAVKAGKAGTIEMADAELLFHDKGDAVSLPLVQRYVEACETELVARWLAALPSFHFAGWASERNLIALDGMVSVGETALAVRTVRVHLKKVCDRVQAKWRLVARKKPANLSREMETRYQENMAKARWELPGEIEEARLEIADLERFVRDHGSHEDNRAIDTMLAQLEKARGKFTPQ